MECVLRVVVFNENISAQNLNSDLRKIQEWAFLWKMQFNPDSLKQEVKVIFSAKKVKPNPLQYILMGKMLSLKPSKTPRFYPGQTIKV